MAPTRTTPKAPGIDIGSYRVYSIASYDGDGGKDIFTVPHIVGRCGQVTGLQIIYDIWVVQLTGTDKRYEAETLTAWWVKLSDTIKSTVENFEEQEILDALLA